MKPLAFTDNLEFGIAAIDRQHRRMVNIVNALLRAVTERNLGEAEDLLLDELLRLGWVEGRMPRLYVTQYQGCAPVVKAFDEGRPECEPWGKIDIPPGGLKSPNPPGGRVVLNLMRQHGGAALSVTTREAFAAVDELAREEGIFSCPESATTLVGLRKAIARQLVRSDEQIVLLNTGSGLKSLPTMEQPGFPVVTSSSQILV